MFPCSHLTEPLTSPLSCPDTLLFQGEGAEAVLVVNHKANQPFYAVLLSSCITTNHREQRYEIPRIDSE